MACLFIFKFTMTKNYLSEAKLAEILAQKIITLKKGGTML